MQPQYSQQTLPDRPSEGHEVRWGGRKGGGQNAGTDDVTPRDEYIEWCGGIELGNVEVMHIVDDDRFRQSLQVHFHSNHPAQRISYYKNCDAFISAQKNCTHCHTNTQIATTSPLSYLWLSLLTDLFARASARKITASSEPPSPPPSRLSNWVRFQLHRII